MRKSEAIKRAHECCAGDSPPLSKEDPGYKPLSLEWWLSSPQPEKPTTDRYRSALTLYLEISKRSKIPLPADTFVARFDLDDGSMRPDKAAIKVYYEASLIEPRFMGAQLLFTLTQKGKAYLEAASS